MFWDFVPHGKTDVKNLGAKGRTRQVEGRSLRRSLRSKAPKLVIALLGTALLACAPVVDNRGYVFDEGLVTKLQKNSMTMEHATGMLGSPHALLYKWRGAVLYSQRDFTESYRAPIETDRKVMALYFNADKVLQDCGLWFARRADSANCAAHNAIAGARIVFIEQIFGNLGRFDGDRLPNLKSATPAQNIVRLFFIVAA